MRSHPLRPRLRAGLAAGAVGLAAAATTLTIPATATAAQPTSLTITSAGGLKPGAIKHTWLIILENKSYDATFTGLNKNSYLWQTLPKQGVLLKNYFGTGHSSQDNYEALVGGQAPSEDLQDDCDVKADDLGTNANIVTTGGKLDATNSPNYGQLASPAGPYAADGQNGCVYPSNVPTLFNQFDAAGVTWKGYAQDLGDQPGRDDGPCGYPGTATNAPTSDLGTTSTSANYSTGSTQTNNPKLYPGVNSFTGVQAAGNDAAGNPGAKEDGYVAKHFPFPWFHSLTDSATAGKTALTTPVNGGTDCDANHIANLDDQNHGLVHDLQSEATTPAFSWITPNNCSDAHDASCKGNNLSGAFNANGDPNYYGVSPTFDPQNTKPVNYTGGLYASDLFLKWYVPLIERSDAFKDGGLIDITFDEGNPPFAGSSFNNANDPKFAPGATNSDPVYASTGNKVRPGVADDPATAYLAADAAGENLSGNDVDSEPAGPNTPLTTKTGTVYSPSDGSTSTGPIPNSGPGHNAFIDRAPAAAKALTGLTNTAGTPTITGGILASDPGRSVTGTGVPANSFVGPVVATGPLYPTTSGGAVVSSAFTLVDASGNPVNTTAAVTSVTLGAQSSVPSASNYDPLFNDTDFTKGGGDTGSVLISPYITPGTTSSTYYNHYSWLRSMEDIYNVSSAVGTSKDVSLTVGTVAGGLDGLGHIGYAAQSGLTPFGPDVFNNPAGTTPTPAPPASLPELSLAVGLPVVALALGGGLLWRRRRTGEVAGASVSLA